MATILVIDDDEFYANGLGRQIQRLGHDYHRAATLADGRREAERLQPDLVFLDVGLPDGSGLSLIDPLRSLSCDPQIVIVTGDGDPDGAEAAIRDGAWDYLSKASPLNDLVLALRRSLDYRQEKRSVRRVALDPAGIVGQSAAIRRCLDQVAIAASSDASVLVRGESGTGKELFAQAIHRNSARSAKPFVVVDCAALPENLAESVLFGHRRGAFTGAVESRVGLLEQADGGTVFLDELGELPLAVQRVFLRALQERRFRPVGSAAEVTSDFRVVAATNRDLDAMVRAGTFREDLLFRVRALSFELPPLRDRKEDVRGIALALIQSLCERRSGDCPGVSQEFVSTLERHSWPGNVRELAHAIEHALAAAGPVTTLHPLHLPTELRVQLARAAQRPRERAPASNEPTGELRPLQSVVDDATRGWLEELMRQTQGDIASACTLSGLSRSRLYALMKEHGVHRR